MTTVLLDTHVLHWWTAEPARLSAAAAKTILEADELALASISWWELAWLVKHGRIEIDVPLPQWLDRLSDQVRTVPETPAVAATAVSLPASFPRDPADRLIYATAIEYGWALVTKDNRLRRHPHTRPITVW